MTAFEVSVTGIILDIKAVNVGRLGLRAVLLAIFTVSSCSTNQNVGPASAVSNTSSTPPTAAPNTRIAGPVTLNLTPDLLPSGGSIAIGYHDAELPLKWEKSNIQPEQLSITATNSGDTIISTETYDQVGGFLSNDLLTLNCADELSLQRSKRTLKVPADFATIQSAVDAAVYGDTVLVAAGTYFENINLKSGIKLIGEGAGRTILDGNGLPKTLINFTGASNTAVSRFTLQNVGRDWSVCSGDQLHDMECSGDHYKAAIHGIGGFKNGTDCRLSSITISQNIFKNNDLGIVLYSYAPAVIKNNVFIGNKRGAVIASYFHDKASVHNNVFWNNQNLAIMNEAAYLDIVDNVISGSTVGIYRRYVQKGRIRCNAFFNNPSDLYERSEPEDISNPSLHNSFTSPGFVDPANGDFRLVAGSPLFSSGCLNSNSDSSREDLGAYGGRLGNW